MNKNCMEPLQYSKEICHGLCILKNLGSSFTVQSSCLYVKRPCYFSGLFLPPGYLYSPANYYFIAFSLLKGSDLNYDYVALNLYSNSMLRFSLQHITYFMQERACLDVPLICSCSFFGQKMNLPLQLSIAG